MSSDLVPTGMSDLDVYLTDRYAPKDDASQSATPEEDAASIRRKCSYIRTKWYFRGHSISIRYSIMAV
ncbi:hypothetical protein FNYG_08929 [Fusarium nygamai]|uniref:Uncharacterized protein n=1 Tax=Gibberella nygamai TaxID=42673 RepID=A0A2K0W6F3_GIBNY|nr:hypothetical protein FNYG_08929 [Fusarium nygamai]